MPALRDILFGDAMMLNPFKITAIFALLIACVLAISESHATAALTKLITTIDEVDPVGQTVTLGGTTTLNVLSSTKITRSRKTVPLTSLVVGDKITATYDGTTLDAATLAATPVLTKLTATLSAIDWVGQTVTLGASTILNVLSSTKITRNRKVVPLTGLVLGDKVIATFDTGPNATILSATGPKLITVTGGVTGVNSGTGVVQLTTGSLNTTAQTRVSRNGQIASLSDLTLLDQVTAHVAFGNALDIQATGPEVGEIFGMITSVDANAGTVSIFDVDGNPFTFNVTASTIIELDDQPAMFSDLLPGMFVDVTYDLNTVPPDPNTLNAFRIDADDGVSVEDGGSLTAKNLAAGTITIQNFDGDSVTLNVNAATRIFRDGIPAAFADLQVGDAVSVEYNGITLLLHEIDADSGAGGGGGGGCGSDGC